MKQAKEPQGPVTLSLQAVLDDWKSAYSLLRTYHERYGHVLVFREDESAPQQLREWVHSVRSYKQRLPHEYRAALDSLGFIWKAADAHWEEMFAALQDFRARHGHCDVPAEPEEYRQLVVWMRNQRRKPFNPQNERSLRLWKLGFRWKPREQLWERRFAELCVFRHCYGHCNVPRGWKEQPQLANWVINQRIKKSMLTEERIARLNSVGFEWSLRSTRWDERFQELQVFRERYGHCNVPQNWPENRALGLWVGSQRKRRKHLSAEHKRRLNALGFVWEPANAYWEQRLAELKDFRTRFGHCRVPSAYGPNPQLGRWVAAQRRNDTLNTRQIRQLQALGFDWSIRRGTWQTRLEELAEFKRRFGHCNVPQGWEENKPLANWVAYIRHPKKVLEKELRARLVELEFSWNPLEDQWHRRCAELKEFHLQHGHCRVPATEPRYRVLYNWINHQRRNRNGLSKDKLRMLETLGFNWYPTRSA